MQLFQATSNKDGKEVKAVPQEHERALWKNYQIYTEKFL